MNILSCVGLANAALVPQRLNEVLAFAFLCWRGFVISGLPVFYGGMCDPRQGENGICGCGHNPVCRISCAGGSDAGDRIFYYFSDGSYYQGVGADYGYAYIVIFFLLDLLIVVRQHKYTTLRTKVIVCAYTAVAAAMIGLQYRYKRSFAPASTIRSCS